jgi:hypothetical protein
LTRLQLRKREFRKTHYLRPGRVNIGENEGKFDFGNSFLKIENVVSISTPFNAQVTEIDHREEVSYIVSEEFSE